MFAKLLTTKTDTLLYMKRVVLVSVIILLFFFSFIHFFFILHPMKWKAGDISAVFSTLTDVCHWVLEFEKAV